MAKLPQVIVRHSFEKLRQELREVGTPPFTTQADGFHVTDGAGRTMGYWFIYDPRTIPVGITLDSINDTILVEGTIVPDYCYQKGILESTEAEWIDTSKLIPPVPPPLKPTVVKLTPYFAMLGSADVVMKVNGTNFTVNSKIVFNGGEEPTTFVSATEVRTTVKPSTASMAVSVPVWVRNSPVLESNSRDFIFYASSAELRLDSITPTTAPRGTMVTVTAVGAGFYPDDKFMVDTKDHLVVYTDAKNVKAGFNSGGPKTLTLKLTRADNSRSSNSKQFTVT